MTKEQYNSLKRDIEERIRNDKQWFTRKIEVRTLDDGFYELVDGHHKIRVCRDLGLSDIPDDYIDVQNLAEEESRESLWSNQIRGNVNPIKQALFLQAEKDKGLTQLKMSEKYHIPRSTVANILRRLKNLHPKIIETECSRVNISVREMNQLMKLKDHPEYQLQIYNVIKKRKVPFEETKGIVDTILGLEESMHATTEVNIMGRWMDTGVAMDEYMEKDFLTEVKFRGYDAFGRPPIGEKKKERELWIYEHWKEILEELKADWIEDKRVDEEGYPAENWGLSELEIDEKTYGKEEVQRRKAEMWKEMEKILFHGE